MQRPSLSPVKTSRVGCRTILFNNKIPTNNSIGITKVSDLNSNAVIDVKEFHTRSYKNIIVDRRLLSALVGSGAKVC